MKTIEDAVLRSPEAVLRCPACKGPLVQHPSRRECGPCAKSYAIADGVLSIASKSGSHGELKKAEMQAFLEAAETMGWRPALEKVVRPKNRAVLGLLLDERRANFVDLLELPANAVAVDIGCGFGGISLQLARRCAHVFAVDNGRERLGFLSTIVRQEAIANISPIHHEDITALPFADESVDLIVMVGVFEYLPVAYPDQPIEEVQRKVLKELHRVLRRGGRFYLGTKNRFGWWYWKGAADHNKLPFGPLLPRSLANVLTQRYHRKPYRIVVDSFPKYRRLLRDAGFGETRFYWPISGYQYPNHYLALDGRGKNDGSHPVTGWKGALTRLLQKLGLLKYVVPHFSIVAQKGQG